ncbi:sensor histidine kinase [Algimonas porphyrae]|uniref:histidine kinase n=1 Tax=Algimonas porphyrae TaxID=1128113 RepID=A0ABQ5V1C1_9PROT|nr:ATP-binding protein [Algimonas porphyrae]GLQ21223.1 hypothetical protein GCM10007854_21780 [Algimonas porphyrae]
MWGHINTLILGLIDWMDLPEDMPAANRIRARLFCIASLSFILVALFNFFGLSWAFGISTPHHLVSFFMASSGGIFLLLLRRFKDPIALSWGFAIASTLGGWLSAYIDYAAATEITGIGLAYSPYMVAILVIVCLLGNRQVAIFYAGLCVMTLIGFYAMTVALGFDVGLLTQNRLSLVLRSSAILLTLAIMAPVSQMIYRTLDDVEDARDRARAAEETRSGFLATMSHEIRTPLNGILGMSDMLAKADIPDTEKRYAKLVQVSANGLMEIINEVLDMAKLEDGTVKIAQDPFSPAEVIQDVCDLFAVRAAEKDLWIGSEVGGLPGQLIGDAPHLRQIMSNLVGNALKFTPEGGVRAGAKLVSVQSGTAMIQFFVQDTGVGIAAEEQTNIFDRFSQTSSAKTTKEKGTGLGLSICRELTEKMGGTLALHSQVGQGTTFHFTLALPLTAKQTQATAEPLGVQSGA